MTIGDYTCIGRYGVVADQCDSFNCCCRGYSLNLESANHKRLLISGSLVGSSFEEKNDS